MEIDKTELPDFYCSGFVLAHLGYLQQVIFSVLGGGDPHGWVTSFEGRDTWRLENINPMYLMS